MLASALACMAPCSMTCIIGSGSVYPVLVLHRDADGEGGTAVALPCGPRYPFRSSAGLRDLCDGLGWPTMIESDRLPPQSSTDNPSAYLPSALPGVIAALWPSGRRICRTGGN